MWLIYFLREATTLFVLFLRSLMCTTNKFHPVQTNPKKVQMDIAIFCLENRKSLVAVITNLYVFL